MNHQTIAHSEDTTMIRTPLYAAGIHYAVRLLTAILVAAAGAAALRLAIEAISSANWSALLPLPIIGTVCCLACRAVFATKPVHGNRAGLAIHINGCWRLVPWSKTRIVGMPWWAFNPVFRVASLHIEGELRPLHFFVNRPCLRKLASLRLPCQPPPPQHGPS
ncbi:MAG: hypothetical protein V2A73_06460 [Pseudomonadota bacterium]